ncbi:hypothetical protein EZI54_12570 [Marinobacter halodurans]|uniref:Uncharacterized protein n=1 Tax=Marinobacter halodurans TaxID=2528979 RepID=A0ABY1ZLU6_9GAMM|nr:hypothetical protein [Marinobacter halodurans]TBW54877.1 hypothetical protein EZI54_12570 [Marinobacter halodurans]
MRTIEPENPTRRNDSRLNRLYYLKQQQLQRSGGRSNSLLYRVLAAEADAISSALGKETTDNE